MTCVLAQSEAPQRFENATAGISLLRPAGWHTASLREVKENLGPLRKAFPNFILVSDIADATVSGLAAASMSAKYSVKNDAGEEFKLLSRMWLIRRRAFVFIVGMSGPQEGPDVSEAEFAATLASIRIQK